MQSVTQERYRETPAGLAISFEVVAYVVLLAFALGLRVAELDTVALSNGEAREALAVWRTLHPDLPGAVVVASSPLLFMLHGLAFSFLGASEMALRIFTALAGALLVAAPVLFRDVLGRERTFLFSLMLTFSPVLLVASRFDAPVIWAVWGAVLGLWGLRRWWLHDSQGYALLATVSFVFTVLLTDPAGFVLALVLLGAGALALGWHRSDDAEDGSFVWARLRGWPVTGSLIAAVLAVFVTATVFMIHVSGLSSVSELLGRGAAGILMAQPGAPPLFPLLTALYYEPVLWLFALAGILLRLRQGTLSLLDKFFAVWVALACAAALVYQGAGAAHALWLIVPLVGLATGAFARVLMPDEHPFLAVPAWGKPVLALLWLALLAILAINAQDIARAVLSVPGANFVDAPFSPLSLIWAVFALALIIISYVMAASWWGRGVALRGAGLGLLVFGLVTSLGSGWTAAVTNADNPVEFWHVNPTARQTFLLRDTLLELTQRESGGFPMMSVFVQAESDGVVGWLLRDFPNVEYITQPGEGRTQRVVLLPMTSEPPVLGGSYVGQDFVIRRNWTAQTLEGVDFFAWWLQRRTRVPGLPAQTMVLWLRQDVYDGTTPAGNG